MALKTIETPTDFVLVKSGYLGAQAKRPDFELFSQIAELLLLQFRQVGVLEHVRNSIGGQCHPPQDTHGNIASPWLFGFRVDRSHRSLGWGRQ